MNFRIISKRLDARFSNVKPHNNITCFLKFSKYESISYHILICLVLFGLSFYFLELSRTVRGNEGSILIEGIPTFD